MALHEASVTARNLSRRPGDHSTWARTGHATSRSTTTFADARSSTPSRHGSSTRGLVLVSSTRRRLRFTTRSRRSVWTAIRCRSVSVAPGAERLDGSARPCAARRARFAHDEAGDRAEPGDDEPEHHVLLPAAGIVGRVGGTAAVRTGEDVALR